MPKAGIPVEPAMVRRGVPVTSRDRGGMETPPRRDETRRSAGSRQRAGNPARTFNGREETRAGR